MQIVVCHNFLIPWKRHKTYFKQIIYIDTYSHTCRSLYIVLAGNSVVPSVSNEANDIQHVAWVKRLWVV